MCLLIASPNGIRPDADVLLEASHDNPHGWGIVWYHRDRLKVTKGLETRDAAIQLDRLSAGTPFVLHYRFTTHGKTNIDNCHPFRLGKWGYVAHNGILRVPTPNPAMSDTWHFARLLVTPYLKQQPTDRQLLDMTEKFVGAGNKIAYMKKDGTILIANERYGDWIDGVWYSNLYSHTRSYYSGSYDPWVQRYGRSKYTTYYRKQPATACTAITKWDTGEQPMTYNHYNNPHWSETLTPGDYRVDFNDIQQCDGCGRDVRRMYYAEIYCGYLCGDCYGAVESM